MKTIANINVFCILVIILLFGCNERESDITGLFKISNNYSSNFDTTVLYGTIDTIIIDNIENLPNGESRSHYMPVAKFDISFKNNSDSTLFIWCNWLSDDPKGEFYLKYVSDESKSYCQLTEGNEYFDSLYLIQPNKRFHISFSTFPCNLIKSETKGVLEQIIERLSDSYIQYNGSLAKDGEFVDKRLLFILSNETKIYANTK